MATMSHVSWIASREGLANFLQNIQWLVLGLLVLFISGSFLFPYPEGAILAALAIFAGITVMLGVPKKFVRMAVEQKRENKLSILKERFKALPAGEQFQEQDLDDQTVEMFEEWLNAHYPMDYFHLDYVGKGYSSHVDPQTYTGLDRHLLTGRKGLAGPRLSALGHIGGANESRTLHRDVLDASVGGDSGSLAGQDEPAQEN